MTELRAPTYHRQRLLLFLLEQAGGGLDKLDLQKLLFLYEQETGAGHYAFVPYKYGCYSFLAADDLELLRKRGWLTEIGYSVRLKSDLAALQWAQNSNERYRIGCWLAEKPLRGDALIKDVYKRFPYYAIHSKMKERILNARELQHVTDAGRPKEHTRNSLYTIGYEGLHFEQYVNKLLENGIHMLCDVRRNPLSRKFGFSGKSLATLLSKIGIAYEHVPELGIATDARKKLETERDRELLFGKYRKTLHFRKEAMDRVLGLIETHGRVALTCFESEPQRCHRHCISERLAERHRVRVCHL